MDTSEKRLIKAKWFERLGLLAVGSLVFQGILVQGDLSKLAIVLGLMLAFIFYGSAFYLLKKS